MLMHMAYICSIKHILITHILITQSRNAFLRPHDELGLWSVMYSDIASTIHVVFSYATVRPFRACNLRVEKRRWLLATNTNAGGNSMQGHIHVYISFVSIRSKVYIYLQP
jgi:hypothetical protein